MIATLTILENGSYSPNAELLFGNKFDNLIDNYLTIHYPSKYNNYFYYMCRLTKSFEISLLFSLRYARIIGLYGIIPVISFWS